MLRFRISPRGLFNSEAMITDCISNSHEKSTYSKDMFKKNKYSYMLTRKIAYTEYIVSYSLCTGRMWPNYCDMPRKKKKGIKKHVVRWFHYNPKSRRVSFFNPKLLQTPIPSIFKEWFGMPIKPIAPVAFARYKETTLSE